MPGPQVLVPVSRFDEAKGRLGEALTPEERAELAQATLLTVVEAVLGAGLSLTILSADPEVGTLLDREAVRIMDEDPSLRGLNAQVNGAIARLAPPPGELLILHADLPIVTSEALRALVAAAPPPLSATMVRSRDGGTNAMLLRPPGQFPVAYGVDSFERHQAAARSAGMQVREFESEEIALDLDTVPDLLALLDRPGGADTRAGRLLRKWRIAERVEQR